MKEATGLIVPFLQAGAESKGRQDAAMSRNLSMSFGLSWFKDTPEAG